MPRSIAENFGLVPEQILWCKYIGLAGRNVIGTAEAGTGKSRVIKALQAYADLNGVPTAITAPTGAAAHALGGDTLHSFAGFGINSDVDTPAARQAYIQRLQTRWNRRVNAPAAAILNTALLIIDEVSMLPSHLLQWLDEGARVVRGARHLPFGGMQIVLIGDFLQLPPVTTSLPLFASPAFTAARLVPLRLHQCHRQKDGAFHDALSAIRRGAPKRDHIELLQTRIVSRPPDGVTTIVPRVKTVHAMNEAALQRLVQRPSFRGTVLAQGGLATVHVEYKTRRAVTYPSHAPHISTCITPSKTSTADTWIPEVQYKLAQRLSSRHILEGAGQWATLLEGGTDGHDVSFHSGVKCIGFGELSRNFQARARTMAERAVQSLTATRRGAQLATGASVIVTQNIRGEGEKSLLAANGTRGTLIAVNAAKGILTIETSAGRRIDILPVPHDTVLATRSMFLPPHRILPRKEDDDGAAAASVRRTKPPHLQERPLCIARLTVRVWQWPLMLAYAMTVHRSQGMTLDAACIDLSGDNFAPQQAYVALSRVRSLEGLYILRGMDVTVLRNVYRPALEWDSLVEDFIARTDAEARISDSGAAAAAASSS